MYNNIYRLLAGYIDYAICFTIALITAYITSFGELRVSSFSLKLSLFVFFIAILLKDAVFKNASIGKRIFKLEIECTKGKFGFICMLKRTICIFLFLGIEVLLVFLNKRSIGDIWSNCNVVSSNRQVPKDNITTNID